MQPHIQQTAIATSSTSKRVKVALEDAAVRILDREDKWFERGVKDAIYVHRKWLSLKRGGG